MCVSPGVWRSTGKCFQLALFSHYGKLPSWKSAESSSYRWTEKSGRAKPGGEVEAGGLCFWRSRENWELEAICILVNLELGDHVCEGRAARGGKLRLGEIRRSWWAHGFWQSCERKEDEGSGPFACPLMLRTRSSTHCSALERRRRNPNLEFSLPLRNENWKYFSGAETSIHRLCY